MGDGLEFGVPEEILSLLPADPYEQLEMAKRITTMAVATRVSKTENEATKLRQKLSEKEQVIFGLQERIRDLEQTLQETTARLSNALDEQAKITTEKNVLVASVKKLNRDVAKLETFKRTLMQSLQEDEETSAPLATLNLSSATKIIYKEPSSSLREEEPKGEHDALRHSSQQVLLSTPHLTPQLTPTGSTVGSPRRQSRSNSPKRKSPSASPIRRSVTEGRISLPPSQTASQHTTAPNSPPVTGSQPARVARVDGKEFFRRARTRLSYEQFSAFLANIKELNARHQTREETLRKTEEIFGQENKDLYNAFEGLLSRHLPNPG